MPLDITTMLQDVEELLPYMTPFERHMFDRLLQGIEVPPWTPFDRQQLALQSEADILFYGGAAGGGKTDLLLGCALEYHRNAIIFRREFAQLRGIRERADEMYGAYGKFNGQLELWRLSKGKYEGKRIEFGACQFEGDEKKYMGRPHDLKGFDEITHFLEAQFRFLITWLRTPIKGQRTRVICTGNPPTDAEGDWVIKFWAPWLDPMHPNPAKEGELRWFVTGPDGTDIEVPNGDPYPIEGLGPNGETEYVQPLSRTFIKSRVEDNPFLMATGYKAILQNLPEPLRSRFLRGDFGVGQEDAEWQVIPTQWVLQAQARWKPTYGEFLRAQLEATHTAQSEDHAQSESRVTTTSSFGPLETTLQVPEGQEPSKTQEPDAAGWARVAAAVSEDPTAVGTDISGLVSGEKSHEEQAALRALEEQATASRCIGSDIARGGRDRTIISERRGVWFAEQICVPGKETHDGMSVVQKLLALGFAGCRHHMDVTGVGTSPVDIGKLHGLEIIPMNSAEKSIAKDRSGKLGFVNCRAEWWWKFREALDPTLGLGLALPPDPELLKDLTAPRWSLKLRGIAIEEKQHIKDRIGRSTDKGDSIIYAFATPYLPGEGYLQYYKSEAEQEAKNVRAVTTAPGHQSTHGRSRGNQ